LTENCPDASTTNEKHFFFRLKKIVIWQQKYDFLGFGRNFGFSAILDFRDNGSKYSLGQYSMNCNQK
jgi:hypothetical protein